VTRLFLIRHGATTSTAEDRFAGAIDVDLSDEGRAQAKRLAERLASGQLAAVYCSPMKRTKDTAAILAAPHGVAPVPKDGLREIGHGRWEGMKRRDVEQSFAEEYARWEADPFTFAPVEGESGLAVMARALPIVREIVTKHEGQTVAIVSHKATLRLVVCAILGIDARGYRDRLDQSPAGLTVLDFKDDVRARLMLFNDTSHYEGLAARAKGRLSKWWDEGPEATP
jgi:probable phosphoglycerate mutase